MLSARAAARRATRRRLLNAYLRETGTPVRGTGSLRIALPATCGELVVEVVHRCTLGHHDYADDTSVPHEEFVAALLAELAAGTGHDGFELAAQIEESTARTARYLARARPRRPAEAHAITRHAEQSVLLGHPFHPTPKSAEGFSDADLERYAPELGATFVPHYFAVARELVSQQRVWPGPWEPGEVAARVPRGYLPLPAHPWQARYLLDRAEVTALIREGGLVPLGPLGRPVYATSSARTVCDPGFPTAWKLPLRVRITNFVRNNPMEHLRRAMEASGLIGTLPTHEGFGVLLESGFRTLNPDAVGPDLAADFAVLYRENPFAHNGEAPRVLAGVLEDPGVLVRDVRAAGDVGEWLRRYLAISLVPLLSLFEQHGVSLEAHVQNSLLCTDGGQPSRLWVRDLEGVAVSSQAGRPLAPGSPLGYSDAEAWQRLCYHAVTNQLGHLVHVLGRYSGAGEERLWAVARRVLLDVPQAGRLLAMPTLPAKANLVSRFTGRAERPLYVEIPNPLRETR
ncbi:IucA/IucC family protein [Saccharomonospora amisosensis]|uniref:IucA/IucC family protein n=1 Tax=Saccharomonospora amisosensis TaxID=1128677 RepID=UPI0014205B93|nr:IucA/IucC family protein [Saccharomonospora amisosensis]